MIKMKKTIITGASTQALRAERHLRMAGIGAKTVKLSGVGRGCVYGVEVDGIYLNEAIFILISLGIKYEII